MTKSKILTTGCVGGSTVDAMAPNRIEINDFVKDEKMFSLYVQALQAMMDTPQDDPRSFFQIASIHGLPYMPWNGVGEDYPGEAAGYCTHGSILFPTWHRPYVALYEQILQKHAVRIAQKYIFDECCWRQTAASLRQPFWDWAKNAVPPPEVISMEWITIVTPDGRRTRVKNPLLRYKFDPVDRSFAKPFSTWPVTVRYPTREGPGAQDDVEALIVTLQANQADLTSKIYNLLTRVHSWSAFSCHTPGDDGSASNSLEAVHDAIHDCVGGAGHMGDPAYAAFDPIFMMHHCQVDRLLSLWSALNPDVSVSEASAHGGTFTIPAHSIVDGTTELTPFRSTQSTFWTSHETLGPCPTHLGYSYPEFNGLISKDKEAIYAHIAGVVNVLYAPQKLRHYLSLLAAKQPREILWKEEKPSAVLQKARGRRHSWIEVYTAPEPLLDDDADDTTSEYLMLFPYPHINGTTAPGRHTSHRASGAGQLWDWSVRIRARKHDLGRSFSVLVFLGAGSSGIPVDPAEWYSAPTYVGAHHAFVNSASRRCANCRRQADVIVEGFVHLNEAIEKHWHADAGVGGRAGTRALDEALNPEDVKPFLSRELGWRVRRNDGIAVSLESLPFLEVMVVAQPFLFPEAGSRFFVMQDELKYYPEITNGHVL
ncbi:tyrosinase [Trametes gibbosa]|nr:tyrosinase [Trametes gibbosa]